MNRRYRRPSVRRQRGQAMVEMVAGLGLVFVAGFLAMAMLGKLNDVRNKVLVGSRYVAWERTVWTNPDDAGTGSDSWWYQKFGAGAQTVTKTDDVLLNEFLARVVAPRRTSLSSSDGSVALSAALPAAWRDPGGAAFVESARDIAVSTRATDRLTAGTTKLANKTIGVYQSPRVRQEVALQMASRTAQDGRVSVHVGLRGESAKRLWPSLAQLTFQDTTTLVTNTWTPDGRLGLVSAIGPEVAAPAAKLDAMLQTRDRQTLVKAMDGVGTVLGPAYLKPGRIEADVVPAGVLK